MLKTARCYKIEGSKLLWEEMVTYDTDYWDWDYEVANGKQTSGFIYYLGKSSQVPKKPDGMTHCYYTFRGYKGTHLDLSNFDTSDVTDMRGMFYICPYLQSLDLSNFDTSNVTNMFDMFFCKSLQSLDLSNFDTSNVTNMRGMFSGCEFLQSLDLSNFDTSNVTNMSWMFDDCESLQSLDLSSFDTSNVKNMGFMFYGCRSLQSLDLSSFNTSNVTDTDSMFTKTNLTKNNTGFGLFTKKPKTPNVHNEDSIFDEIDELFHNGSVSSPTSLIKDLKSRGYSEAEIVGTIYVDIKLGKLDMNLYKPVIDSYISKVVTPSIIKVFSDRSVGEVLDILYAKYPRDLVNEAMCMYLRPQYLVD